VGEIGETLALAGRTRVVTYLPPPQPVSFSVPVQAQAPIPVQAYQTQAYQTPVQAPIPFVAAPPPVPFVAASPQSYGFGIRHKCLGWLRP
jgi:hypothetical protein